MPDISNEQIKAFVSLFKGREDVFATRWERDGKSGYMPAYDLDWNEYSKHKAKGGTLKDFFAKQYSKLTDQRIINLKGLSGPTPRRRCDLLGTILSKLSKKHTGIANG